MSDEDLYAGREQTLVKHFVLQKYLSRFAHIVGTHKDVLTYVDCFSGPWNVRSENLADSSFAIALTELRRARDTHAQRGHSLKLRCFFLEKNRAAYGQLKEFAQSITDAKIETRNATLEESVPEIVEFVRQGGAKSFPFIFIDPTGWSGFAMDTIKPLLRLDPGEVLINFMMGHIRRFLDSPQEQTQESFQRLFGSGDFREKVQGLAQQDREDAAVSEYARNVKQVGGFTSTCSAIILHPERDRTHFNLIYATRNPKGIEVFKEAEKKAMEVQELARAEAHQRKRLTRTGQHDLFSSKELHDSSYYDSLRNRYTQRTRSAIVRTLESKRRVLYDEAWEIAVSEPLSWESDLKDWIEEWKNDGRLSVEGMKPRQRVPHRNERNFLIWR
jgi:three-Cys-motif partner protein